MKKVILSAALMLAVFSSFGQYNYKFNYQAAVRNGSGTPIASGSTVGLRISILEGSATGTPLYQETHTAVVNNVQGLVNLVIGDGTPTVGALVFAGNFEDLSQDKYLKIEVDPAGGTAYTDMGATKLQFVPYAAHAFTASIAKNGTQWADGAGSSISYSAGNVNIGTSSPTGTSSLNVEKATSADHVVSVTQTGTTGGGFRAAIYGKNNSTTGSGIGVYGRQAGNGWGVHGNTIGAGIGVFGSSDGSGGVGVYGQGTTGVKAATNATGGIAIDLEGFIKVSGASLSRTAYKTTPLAAAAGNITLSYSGAASTDIVFVTPVYNSTSSIMPSWELIWTSPNWIIYNASDDGFPSNFPAGTSFNILVIKQ